MAVLALSEERRFWANVQKGEPDECWIWVGGRFRRGYGSFWVGKKNRSASVISFLLHGGRLTARKPFVLHSCHNPPCVNPRHLRSGTHLQNMADRAEAGEIRRLYATGKFSTRKLAAKFPVGKSTIFSVVGGDGWRHVR